MQFKKVGILIVGWLFIGLGIPGLFLPLLPGILFILIGLSILSSRITWMRHFLESIEDHFPHQFKRIEIWREKIRSWFKKD